MAQKLVLYLLTFDSWPIDKALLFELKDAKRQFKVLQSLRLSFPSASLSCSSIQPLLQSGQMSNLRRSLVIKTMACCSRGAFARALTTSIRVTKLVFGHGGWPLLVVNFQGQLGAQSPQCRQNGARIHRLNQLCVGGCREVP